MGLLLISPKNWNARDPPDPNPKALTLNCFQKQFSFLFFKNKKQKNIFDSQKNRKQFEIIFFSYFYLFLKNYF